MPDLLAESLRVLERLNEHHVDYVVIGGVAMNLHGLVRGTEDLDLFLRPDPDNIDRLRNALRDLWPDPSIDEITAGDLCGDFPAVRYGPPDGALYLDLLTRLGGFASYEDLEVTTVVLRGVPVRVVTPETLFWLKKDTVRPIDRADAEALRRTFGFGEET